MRYWAYIKNNKANELLELHKPLEAQEIYRSILNLTLSLPNPSQDMIATLNNNLGHTLLRLAKYPQAKDNYNYALEIRLAKEDKLGIAICYCNLGELSRNVALRIYEENSDEYRTADEYHNLGLIAQEQRKYEECDRLLSPSP